MISFDKVFKDWLHPFGGCKCDDASLHLIQQMNLALDAEEYVSLWTLFDRLVGVSEVIDDTNECAELILWCGRVQYLLGNLTGALDLFRKAASKFPPDSHLIGITQWLIGYVLWQLPGEKDNAIAIWKRSIVTFNRIIKDNRFIDDKGKKWYFNIQDQIQNYLQEAIAFKANYMNRRTIEIINGYVSDISLVHVKSDDRLAFPKAEKDGELYWILSFYGSPSKYEELKKIKKEVVISIEEDNVQQQWNVDVNVCRQLRIEKRPHFFNNLYSEDGRILISDPINHFIIQILSDSYAPVGIDQNDFVLCQINDHGRANDFVVVDDKENFADYICHNRDVIHKDSVKGRVVAVLKPAIQPFPNYSACEERDQDDYIREFEADTIDPEELDVEDWPGEDPDPPAPSSPGDEHDPLDFDIPPPVDPDKPKNPHGFGFPPPANPDQPKSPVMETAAIGVIGSVPELYKLLLERVKGNERKAKQLLEAERLWRPKADRSELLKNAIIRWEYNNRNP